MYDDEYLILPNADYTSISHPNGANQSIEIGLVKDHRFVFYFWFKWWKKTARRLDDKTVKAPTLVTIDWHQDLSAPRKPEKQDLRSLNLESHKEVALFSWDKLDRLNDGHILAAAYLNLIGDIYVLYKQDVCKEFSFYDRWKKRHKVICFDSKESLFKKLSKNDIQEIYFDIDLDYFIKSRSNPCSRELGNGSKDLVLMKKQDILSILDTNSEFMQWIFERIKGMTIATEPNCCGGVINSNKIYSLVHDILFDGQLFSGKATWKHLKGKMEK